MIDGLRRVAEVVDARRPPDRPCLVSVTGGVAVGKSTFVEHLCGELADPCAVVASDCFLWPNDVLEAQGLAMRKGFPETYDVASLREAATGLIQGRAVAVPIYSHRTYDIAAGEERQVTSAPVVLIEGLHLTTFLSGLADVCIHLEAGEAANERWYLDRFDHLVAGAGEDPESFYRVFLGFDPEVRRALAQDLWRSINLVNLHDHIAPTRDQADVVVTLSDDHRIVAVEELTRRGR